MGMTTMQTLRRVVPFLWGNDWKLRVRLVFGLIFVAMSLFLNVSIPLVLRHAIAMLSTKQPWALVFVALLAYGTIWTLSQVMASFREIVLFRLLNRGARLLTGNLFKHLHTLSQRFHTEKSTGAIISALDRAQHALPDIFWGLFLMIGPTTAEIIISACVLWYLYGAVYGVLLLSILASYAAFSYFAITWSTKAQQEYNEIRKKTSARIVDSLINYETTKYFANHDYEFEQCDKLLAQEENAATQRWLRSEYVQIGQFILIGCGLILLTYLSGKMVFTNAQTVSDFVTINSYLLQFVLPLAYFGYTLRKAREGLIDLQHVFELLDQKPEIVDASGALDLWVNNPSIIFDHVTFAYDKRRIILDEVTFEVKSGQTVAFVGATGSGKTTIGRLLYRFYDITSGVIKIDNIDIKMVTQKSLQRMIGIIPQDTVLFNTTLLENIMYARPEASKEDLAKVVQMAQLKDLIERLPDGYLTMMGERGAKISGGERQRIGIARVLLKQPAIYIFDEATSALDTKTEKEIQKSLEEISQLKTTIIIAHRLSTVIHADNIIVLDKGKVAEQGTHEELIALDGMYARLWAQQSKVRKK